MTSIARLEVDINAKKYFKPISDSKFNERFKNSETDKVYVYEFNYPGVVKSINFNHLLNKGKIKLIINGLETITIRSVKDNNNFISFKDNRHYSFDTYWGAVNNHLTLKQTLETLNFARICDGNKFVFINCDIGDVEISYYQIYDKDTNLPPKQI